MSAKGKHHLRSFFVCVTVCRSEPDCFIEAQCCGFKTVFDKTCLALGRSVDIIGACVAA